MKHTVSPPIITNNSRTTKKGIWAPTYTPGKSKNSWLSQVTNGDKSNKLHRIVTIGNSTKENATRNYNGKISKGGNTTTEEK